MTVFNARALASLVSVAGAALSKRLTVILNAIVKVMETQPLDEDEELRSAVDEALRTLLESVCDAEGLNTLMMLLLGWYVEEHSSLRDPSPNSMVTGPRATAWSVVLTRATS